jgi:hypothetical protein
MSSIYEFCRTWGEGVPLSPQGNVRLHNKNITPMNTNTTMRLYYCDA